jgi:hypothetical protein
MAENDIKIIYMPPQPEAEVIEEAPKPFTLEPSPVDRLLGRESTSPEVGSLRDTIERQKRGMPTASEVSARTEEAQIIEALKGAGSFDPADTFESANGYMSLFDVGRSNENTEKFAKFKAKFPKGDMIFVPTDNGTVPVARRSSEEPFRRLGSVGSVAATLASPATALGIGAGIMTGGASLPVSMAIQGVAGAAGSALDNFIESMRGYQESSYGSMIGDAALEAALNAGIEPVARGLTGAMGTGKQAVQSSFRELAEAGSEIPILRGQYGNPIKTTIFKFASRFSPQAKLALREQRATIRGLLEENASFTPEMLAAMSDRELANYMDMVSTDIVLSKIGVTGTDRYAAGKALTDALQKYKQLSRAATDALYTQAESFGKNEMWNARPLQQFAKEKMQPVVGRAAREPDAAGNLPMGDDVYGDVQLSAPLNRELASVYEAITALEPTIAMHKGNSGLKQLMTLRTRVGDLLLQDLPSEQNKQVAELYDVLTRTIENPATGNAAFEAAWKEANSAYRASMDFMRFGQVKAALNNKPAEKVAEKFMQPGNLDFLKLVRTNLTADPSTAPAWDALRRGFQEQYTTSTEKLATASKALDKYGADELNVLLTKDEQRNLRTASFQAQQLLNGPVSKMLKEFNTDGARILEFAQTGNAAEIKRMVDLAGGVDSDTAAALRGGVFQNLLNASEYVDENTGRLVVDPSKLSKALGELRKSNRLAPLFRPEDWRRFDNWEKVGAVVGKASDEGSSIQAGEVASELAETPFSLLTNPMRTGKLLLKLGFTDTLGYVLSRPASMEKVLRATDAMDAKRRDRAAINATWQVLQDLQSTYNDRENLEPMQEAERTAEEIKKRPGMWDYLKNYFGDSEPKLPFTPEQLMAPPPVPNAPLRQEGSLQPKTPSATMPRNNMAQAMPPQPQQAPTQNQGIAGTRYAALFPGDTLGALAASGGIASLQG